MCLFYRTRDSRPTTIGWRRPLKGGVKEKLLTAEWAGQRILEKPDQPMAHWPLQPATDLILYRYYAIDDE